MQAVQTCSASPAVAGNATIRLLNTVGQRKRTPEDTTTDEHRVIQQTRAVEEMLLAYCSGWQRLWRWTREEEEL